MSFYTQGISASNMVLLRNSINCIYGVAPADARISMTFRNQAFETVSDSDGNWKIEFNSGLPCIGETIIIYCEGEEDAIVFENVAVGEVWLCSGQSNMQLTMERLKYTYKDEFLKPENQNIRMVTIPVVYNFDGEQSQVQNIEWKVAGPETLSSLSGTAYFFAKKIQEELGIPVGIVNASQGGTPITAWMNAESLTGFDSYLERLAQLREEGYVENVLASEKAVLDKWNDKTYLLDPGVEEKWEELSVEDCISQGWKVTELPGEQDLLSEGGVVWFKKEINLTTSDLKELNENGARLWLGVIRDADKAYINGVQVGVTYYVYPPRRYDIPEGVLKEGVNVITLRVQQNLGSRKMLFWQEKHYAIASNNVDVIPSVVRNVERKEGLLPLVETIESENGPKNIAEKGVYIPLQGEWYCCVTSQVENIPATTFFEYEPTALYNAMLAPCFNYYIRGVLWYQGESNAEKSEEYCELLCRMISLWREKFSYCPKKMPFVVMQLPSWADDISPDSYPVFSDWARLREAQLQAVSKMENCALSVGIDAGEWNDLHPEKKLTGGTRAAEQALRLAYKKTYISPAKITGIKKVERSYFVTFDNEVPLSAFEENKDFVDFEKPSNKVGGFGLLYKRLWGDGVVVMCHAEIVDVNVVKVMPPMLPIGAKALEIRYLWANCPEYVNLYTGTIPVLPGRIQIV